MSDKTPFGEVKVAAAQNLPQIINIIEDHIASLESHLGEFPGPYDPLNGAIYIRWERMLMSWIGQVTGLLKGFQIAGVLPPEQYIRLDLRAKAAVNHAAADMVMEGKRK